jgi:hypothetical protein
MKLSLLTLVAMLAITSVADAQAFRTTHWVFTTNNTATAQVADYSTHLQEDVVIALPKSLVDEGWSCIRKPVIYNPSTQTVSGSITCVDGIGLHTTEAKCSLTQNDKSHVWMGITMPELDNGGVHEDFMFYITCESIK